MDAAEAYGLLVKNQTESLPLKNVSVSSIVQGYLLGIQSVLKYENTSSDPVEVLFRTPVDDSHAVVGLKAVIDGRRIHAEIKGKEEARAEYDDAIASGRTAAIGEEKEDVFSLALGNLPPGKEAEIYLTMVGELEIDAEGSVRFALPTVLKPRYTPLGGEDPLAPVTGAEALAGQIRRTETPSVYSFELNIAGMEGIADVTSPSHKIRTTFPPDSSFLKVQLDQDAPVTEDIVILIKPKDPHQPMVVVEPGIAGSPGAFMSNPAVMVSFFPEFKGNMKQVPCEFIFVVDRSRSMSGQYIKEAAKTLMLFLKSLPVACYFNIVGFGSRFETLFPESVPYNQSNLDKAIAHTEDLKADLVGGTHLYSPLEYIFSQPLHSHLTRQVFILTDGIVSNTAQVIGLVRKNASKARCFSFGIGSGASTHLVRGIAEAGRGTAEFVTRGERMQPKVIRSLKHAMQPAVTGARVTFDLPPGYSARVAPTVVPPIFIGERTIVYALLESSNEAEPGGGKATVTLQGHLLGETVKHILEVKLRPLAESGGFPLSVPTIHHLTGKAFIRDLLLEEGPGEMAMKEEVVKLSCECGVISKHTAFIAIDEEQKEPVKGSLQIWDVVASRPAVEEVLFCQSMPIYARHIHSSAASEPCGSSGYMQCSLNDQGCTAVQSRVRCRSAPRDKSQLGLESVICDLSIDSAPFRLRSTDDARSSHRSSGCMSSRPAAPRTRTQTASARSLQCRDEPVPTKTLPNPTRSNLSRIISLQLASGAWTLSAELASLLGQNVQQLKTACPASPCEGDVELVWATALALCYLEKRHAKRKDEWELLAVKASEWLAQHVPEGHTSEVFREKADNTVA